MVATTEGANWVYEQVAGLRDTYGYDVTTVLSGEQGTLPNKLRAAKLRVLTADFEFLNATDLFALPKKVLTLARLFRREQFDVVQTHLFHSMVIGRLAAWLADVPIRLSMVAGPYHLEAYTPRWIDASTQWMETALIPSCQYTRTLYRSMGLRDERMEVIYYGANESNFDPQQHRKAPVREEYGWLSDTPLIGMVAYFYGEFGTNRWTPPSLHGRANKRQEDLILAMPTILEHVPDAKLILVGSAWEQAGQAYMEKLIRLVESLGLSDVVKFTGFRTDIPELLKALDVAVQASLSENLGGTIEGLLMETPMVATRTGGLVDTVVDGETGLLVNPRDPVDLARAVITLLKDRSLARNLAVAGRELMLKDFTLSSTVASEHLLYQRLDGGVRQRYSLLASFRRGILAPFVCGYLAVRYWLVDLRLLPAWDAGWRPWHVLSPAPWIMLARHIGWRIKRRLFAAGIRPINASHSSQSEQLLTTRISPPPRVALSGLGLRGRMLLYRLYAFIGRRKLGWGLRRRIREALLRLWSH